MYGNKKVRAMYTRTFLFSEIYFFIEHFYQN